MASTIESAVELLKWIDFMIKAQDYEDGDYDLTPLPNSTIGSGDAVDTEGVSVHQPSPSPPRTTTIEPAEREVEEGEVILPEKEEQVMVDISTATTTTAVVEPVVFTDVDINEGIAHGVAVTSSSASSFVASKGKQWQGKGKKRSLLSSTRTLQVYPKKGVAEFPMDVLLRRSTTHKTQRALIKTLSKHFTETNEECKRLRESQYLLLHQADEIDLQLKRLAASVGVVKACLDTFIARDMEDDSDLSDEEEGEEEEEEEEEEEKEEFT